MGLYQSKFIDALKRGADDDARYYYMTKKSVRDSVEPNAPLGPTHGENSVLHYAALHALEWLYRELLGRGGKPDMRNAAARNCLHLVCCHRNRGSSREAILRVTLADGLVGMDVEHVLRERDEEGNTALHLAAAAGLRRCVELLLERKADLYLTNKREQTAAECAAECKHTAIATLLEARMVFSGEDESSPAHLVEADHTHLMELAEAPSGMRDSDLRSMKDQLLIETSELLGVSLFTSEALLRHHGWSKEQLLEAWMDNPTEACEKAGVQLPTNLGTHNMDAPTPLSPPDPSGEEGEERECGVCVLEFPPDIAVPCGHFFCRDCWRQYLHQKIEAGDAHSIVCPEYGCFKLVPIEVIEAVVSREMTQRYLQFDIKAFVESHPTIRWCPYPDCHRAVRMTTPTADTPGDAPQPTTVHCGNEHYFCWSCSGEPHVPMFCEDWQKWLGHVQEMSSQMGDRTATQLDDAASQRWLATRSKPCPKCRAPIEKNDGCNHMCCKKCKHDFCWVCLDEWKQHNTSTGGYFECNRYAVRRKAQDQLEKRKEDVMEGVEEAEKLRRFIHYYERYKTHKENLQLELPFLEKANAKTEKLRASLLKTTDSQRRYTVSMDMTFIEEAIRELLSSRRILIASYPFGYYVEGGRARRLFENIQGTLEQVTELLAQAVARPHLRRPRTEIVRLTWECREKRSWLVKDCRQLPDPTPPSRRRAIFPHFGLHHDSDSDDSLRSDDETIDDAFLRRVLGYESRRRSRRERGEEGEEGKTEQELLQALQLSRQEHEERTQLEADIERAKQLSLADTTLPTAQPTANSGLLFIGETAPPPRRLSPSPPTPSHLHTHPHLLTPPRHHHHKPPIPRHSPEWDIIPSPLPLRPTRFSPPPPLPKLTTLPTLTTRPRFSPPPPLPKLTTLPTPTTRQEEEQKREEERESSSSSSGEWDDEEMARALSLSLMGAPPSNSPPPAAAAVATPTDTTGGLLSPFDLQRFLQNNH